MAQHNLETVSKTRRVTRLWSTRTFHAVARIGYFHVDCCIRPQLISYLASQAARLAAALRGNYVGYVRLICIADSN